MIRALIQTLGFTIVILCIVIGWGISLENPDMTPTRLLITFWQQYLIINIGLILGNTMVVLSHTRKKNRRVRKDVKEYDNKSK
ncbi:MAG: hypothetical protein K0R00_913 [Herbinix sp.]|jgi:uncharacterized membrane protein|nr:hypothetical protein [Herbinix sp.]